MRRCGKELLASLVAALLFSAGVTAAERQGPKISVTESRFDFGVVEQGTRPEHVFEIVNAGDDVLEIRQVQPTWGCTAGLVSSNRLEPGAAAHLKVSVDTAGRSGRMSKQVTIHTNDRLTPALPVTVTLTVTAGTAVQK